ncbi:iron-containing alcohol dehydrogenase [Aestuariivirga litoralis]|uniref:Iron-containing alcohol dehydrogenase n=1 Tax=Aestuariivirga litoralis TaxID=2650924 RepID=A0A2W2BWM4_9HYPH|nr:iron-containing alcohol dehydrogenase [Aestuariivirga litoralis]PZF77836.1 iron-containing alcohol dehydrogenase [Aestuariivirga litoralis]
MSSFTLSFVPEIRFGAGRLGDIAPLAEAKAGKGAAVLLVADPALKELGITAQAVDILARAGHATEVYDGFTGEPSVADIDAAATQARRHDAKAVIGLGGGSALDTAKLVACCAVSGQPAAAYALRATPLPKNRLALIAVPTTAGTGSEVTRVSVYADANKVKVWAWGEELKPDVAILDPELSVALPAAVTAGSGLDALVHAIEAATNKQANPGNDLYCLKAISLIAANLERAVTHPADLAARGAMLLAACYGGIGIDNCGTALAHNISHAVANLAPIAHGRATGLAMLATMDWVAEGNRPGFARVSEAMGTNDAVAGFDRLVRASGVAVSPGLSGITAEALARHMAAPANAPMRKSTLRYPTDGDLVMLAERFLSLR